MRERGTTLVGSTSSERLALDPTSELWGEHRSRYRFAARLASGKRVLDAACGVGFGARMLAEAGARQVVGVDLSNEALAEARATSVGRPPLLTQADLEHLPFPSASFDLVVSMETIEHVAQPEQVVSEFARCLVAGGTLVLSTPNRLYRPGPDGRPRNPYHLREYAPEELERLLEPWFEVALYGQVVDQAYPAVPFLLRPEQEGLRSWQAVRLIPWKLANRLPYRLKNGLSVALSRRPFYPSEAHYSFRPDAAAVAHDLLAVAIRRA